MGLAMMNIDAFNRLEPAAAAEALARCCGSGRWVEEMLQRRPYRHFADICHAAEAVWWSLDPADWLEAFRHHPKIGDVDRLREKFAATAQWAQGEQAGVNAATEETLAALAEGNLLYEARFGYIFIVCATGKSAGEMLALLQERLGNEPDAELKIAAGEQAKITRIRLEKLLCPPP